MPYFVVDSKRVKVVAFGYRFKYLTPMVLIKISCGKPTNDHNNGRRGVKSGFLILFWYDLLKV